MIAIPPLVLASASPRRRELLAELGVAHIVDPSGFDEAALRHLPARRQSEAAALAKAAEVHRRRPRDWVLGADTVVSVDGHTLGKPADPRDAAAMLTRLSGRDHSVITALAIAAPDGRTALGSAISRVRFHRLGLPEIEAYLASGEHRDKAGAYAIQGAAAAFASLARGHRDTVVGLPGHLLGRLLGELGHPAASRVSESARVRGSANLHRP